GEGGVPRGSVRLTSADRSADHPAEGDGLSDRETSSRGPAAVIPPSLPFRHGEYLAHEGPRIERQHHHMIAALGGGSAALAGREGYEPVRPAGGGAEPRQRGRAGGGGGGPPPAGRRRRRPPPPRTAPGSRGPAEPPRPARPTSLPGPR